jgi:hypothetical protein
LHLVAARIRETNITDFKITYDGCTCIAIGIDLRFKPNRTDEPFLATSCCGQSMASACKLEAASSTPNTMVLLNSLIIHTLNTSPLIPAY